MEDGTGQGLRSHPICAPQVPNGKSQAPDLGLMFRLPESEDKYKALRKLCDVLSKMETTFSGKEDLRGNSSFGLGCRSNVLSGVIVSEHTWPIKMLGQSTLSWSL